MSSLSPPQWRKSKKVKKLLIEGVPASVRYLIWSHLTDGKAKVVPGVYSQLGNRERVGVADMIEEDVRVWLVDKERGEHSAEGKGMRGPVLSLLQAYLTMVPDVRYTTGACSICLIPAMRRLYFVGVGRFDAYCWTIAVTRAGGRCVLDICFSDGYAYSAILFNEYSTDGSGCDIV
jgi:hypothetical protein